MRVTVTAVSPATRRRADVVIDADLDTPVAEIVAQLDSILKGGVPQRSHASFVALAAGHPVPLTAPVVQQAPAASVPRLFTVGQRVPGNVRLSSPFRYGPGERGPRDIDEFACGLGTCRVCHRAGRHDCRQAVSAAAIAAWGNEEVITCGGPTREGADSEFERFSGLH
jgi:hypothetical protein